MNALSTYLKERFPVLVSATLALATAAYLIGCLAERVEFSTKFVDLAFISLAFLGFMLRMRVTDEFKDLGHDNSNYPNRPVQRGAITKHQLVAIGVAASALELSAVLALAQGIHFVDVILWYFAVVVFSVLTRFEFFAKEFLDRHFTLYFLVHQGIFLIYPLWIASRYEFSWGRLTLGMIGFVAVMAAMEIVRKYEIRRNPAGDVVADTYIAVWGNASFWVLLALLELSAALLFTISGSLWIALIAALSTVGLLLVRKKSETVRAIAAFAFVSQSLVMFLS